MNRLAAVSDQRLYRQAKSERSPAGVYNISLTRVLERIGAAVGELETLLDRFSPTGEPPSLAEALAKQELVLYAMREHLDDCELILKSVAPETNFGKLPAVKAFRRDRSEYMSRIGEAVNKIKHENARLRSISMAEGECYCPGYYVETATDDGGVGPDANLHDGGHTAWSSYRDVKLHFVQLFLTGSALDASVAVFREVEPTPCTDTADTVLELARRIKLLPDVVYPNEIRARYPQIQLLRGEAGISLSLTYEVADPLPRSFRRPQVRSETIGDGFTGKFRMPYLRDVRG